MTNDPEQTRTRMFHQITGALRSLSYIEEQLPYIEQIRHDTSHPDQHVVAAYDIASQAAGKAKTELLAAFHILQRRQPPPQA